MNGWCEDGEYNSGKNWVHLGDSGITSNHPHREDLTKNLKLTNFPLDSYSVQTFMLGIDMYCKVDFFFHHNCFACAEDGSKIEWSSWGATGIPKIETRCWFSPKPQCTNSDYEKIRERDWRRVDPEEPLREALNYIVESEDTDEKVFTELIFYLDEAKGYFTSRNFDKAIAELQLFKEKIEEQQAKENISKHAMAALLRLADAVIDDAKQNIHK